MAGTATMSNQEVGAYMRLLCYAWDAGSVPNDPKERSRICACSMAQEREIWKKVGAKFSLQNDVYLNERMEEERKKQAEYRRRQSDKGKASAAVRWQPEGNQAVTVVTPRLQPEGNSSSSSSSSVKTKTTAVLTTRRNLSAEFEHPRFDVPTSWHLRHVKDLSDGEAGMLNFYRWLAARVDRTNEDTIVPGVEHGRFVWLDRCFTEWSASRRTASPSDALVEATKRRQAEMEAKHDPRFDGLTLKEKFALAKELREAEAS